MKRQVSSVLDEVFKNEIGGLNDNIQLIKPNIQRWATRNQEPEEPSLAFQQRHDDIQEEKARQAKYNSRTAEEITKIVEDRINENNSLIK